MSDSDLRMEPFELSLGPDVTIRGEVRVKRESGTKPVLLLIHGFKGFKDWGFFPFAAEHFALQNWAVVTFNLSHNGVNVTDFDELDKFGRNTYSREQEDIAAITAALSDGKLPMSEYLDADQLFVVGHSRGGGNAVLFAADHPDLVRGVVTWNGVGRADLFTAEFREQVLRDGVGYVANARTKQDMPIESVFFEDLDQHQERFNIPERLAGMSTPVLCIQGLQDSERLVNGFRTLQQAAPQHRFAELAGADHTFGAKHPFVRKTDDLERALAITGAFFAPLLERK
ncbi:alpha/beta hydrolase family protein [Paenibacillus daejeonensis]|uniref:alpha/beta hydrolase family protein n=1 Tax=Paenibacillus daejeonensis TaxID=135193 RepID=UPI001FE17D08|nr:alpha/beta fold hydrolase [Paenibacillus daejeonensis]